MAGVLDAVLSPEHRPRCSVFFITDAASSDPSTIALIRLLRSPGGVGVFTTTADVLHGNVTLQQLPQWISQARKLRQVSWCVSVVVVSDDLTFLATFAQWSLKGRLLVWSTRLLVLTRLPLHHLHILHTLLSNTNSMLIIYEESLDNVRCGVYLQVPYSPLGAQAVKVASWAPQRGLALTSSLPLFPDKFSRLLQRPTLKLATEINPLNSLVTQEAGVAGKLQFVGPAPDLVSYLAKALNFSYTYLRPSDGAWGSKREDGSWSGMVGMVTRQEVDIAVGPFGVSGVRAEVVDFTVPILTDYHRFLGARGRPEVDPWGFLFPLEPLVWAAILGALLVLPLTTLLMASCFSPNTHGHSYIVPPTSAFLRILLNQNVLESGTYWWWERVVLTVWGLVTVVLTQSYAGNLMALLAVRHIPQPYQSLRDVLDDRSVITVWEQGSSNAQLVREVETGVYREMAELNVNGRLIYKPHSKYEEIIDTLVRRGDHVLIEVDFGLQIYMSRDFTAKGQCYFYTSKEEFLPLMLSLASKKGSPLVSALSIRIQAMTEAGLFRYWMKAAEPNSTVCNQAPTTITVQESLTLVNILGMFVILAAGHTVCVFVVCLELVVHNVLH
ncbi:glutamate receptor U1-like [Procambarus clarkii]|uniref:glutamate receptor U1-like n=1 Tax=Procambarus clarkii TaxID=6728 RepID=UPI0037437259